MTAFMVRLLTLSALFLLLAAPVASAGTREKILRECQQGRITGNYTPAQLRDARKNIPTDIDEYSDCRDVLGRATLSGRSGGSGGGGGGGASGASANSANSAATSGGDGTAGITQPANKREAKALENALERPQSAAIDGERIVPGASGFAADAARHGLPTTLLIVLILLGACALAAAAPAARRRVIARRQP